MWPTATNVAHLGTLGSRETPRAARSNDGPWVWATLVVVLAGCGTEPGRELVEVPDPLLPELDAAQLFEGRVPTFELDLLDTTWARFRAEGHAEQYARADLRFDGKYVGQVAVRVKGQYSIEQCYPDGELVCDKLSLRLKFDANDEDLRFFGRKRLALHSMARDPSHLRERLAYGLYRAMDIPAPRSAWAKLVVQGSAQGLYSMVEEIDGVFTDDRFDEHGDGDLYKEVWPTSLDASYYAQGLETNEETADVGKVVAFAEALTAPDTAEERLQVLEQYMDVAALSRYMAVDDAIANWDGVTTFYEDHDGHNHNFFLYADETGREPPFVLIPWDMDNTFQAANWRTRAPGWRETVDDCGLTNGVYPPSCDPLLSALLLDQAGYASAAQTLLQGPFAPEAMQAQIERNAELIEEAVAEDPFGPSVEAWERDVAELERNLDLLRQQLQVFADGKTVRRVGIDPMRVNDFSDLTPLEAELGISIYAAEGVTGRVAVIEDGELSGLRLAFDMPSAEGGPWVSFALPFPGGDADLRGRAGIRFKAKGTNLPPFARLRLESSASIDPSQAWGWELLLGNDTQTQELRFEDASWSEEGAEPQAPLDEWLQHANGVSFVFAGAAGMGALELDDVEIFAE